jgi:hypothetical protein
MHSPVVYLGPNEPSARRKKPCYNAALLLRRGDYIFSLNYPRTVRAACGPAALSLLNFERMKSGADCS